MKKFTIPCDFGGKKAPFDVYIGMPKAGNHPLQNQAHWLATERGGTIPSEVMESFSKLLALSEKNGVSFEDLCVYALEAANEEKKKMQGGSTQPPASSAAPPPSGNPTAPPSENSSSSSESSGGTGSSNNNSGGGPESVSLGSVNLTDNKEG